MNDKDTTIKVSVCCVTYNHSLYLRECLEGLVMQKTSFSYEILIHDDASTDGTTDIVREYAAAYPELIRPVIQTENQYSSKTRAIITTYLLPIAKGEYIALCEGDDYWTDPLKLQKQVDVLDSNPDITLCVHPAIVQKTNGKKKAYLIYKNSQIAHFTDIIRWKQRGWPTASFMYRKTRMKNYPDFCLKCHIGDAPLAYYMAVQGKVYYTSEVMSVYRKEAVGSHSKRYKVLDNSVRQEKLQTELEMIDGFDRLTNYAYHLNFIERKLRVQAHILAKRRKYMPVITYENFHNELRQIPIGKQFAILARIYILPIFKGNIFKANKKT